MKKLLITFFGLGYLPIAPGTWGSLGALIIFYLLAWQLTFAPLLLGILTALTIIAFIVGTSLGGWANKAFGKKDPGAFVLDEVVGMWISVMLIPFVDFKSLLIVGVVQFILFRIFDIVKPPPARQLEKLADGWGIMLDDVMAGIYANIFGQIIFRFLI